MYRATTALTVLLLALPAARASTALDAKGARTIAEKFLRTSPKLGLGARSKLKSGMVTPVRANAGMPVTGTGGFALEIDAHRKGEGGRRFQLFVDHNGEAHQLAEQELNLAHKVPRRFRMPSSLSPTSLIQIGLTASLGLLQIPNLFGAGASNGATNALTGAALALLIGNTTKAFFDAHKSRTDGRSQSMVQTIQFIKDRQETKTRTPAYPNLAQAYRFYRQKLSELAPGTKPMALPEFSERVWAYGF
jgi:hypothetical protein